MEKNWKQTGPIMWKPVNMIERSEVLHLDFAIVKAITDTDNMVAVLLIGWQIFAVLKKNVTEPLDLNISQL